MEGLVMVGLRHGDIIFETPRHRFPEGVHHTESLITVLFLVGIEDDPEGGEVKDLVKIDMLFFHLFIDAVEMLRPAFDFNRNTQQSHFLGNDTSDFLGIIIPFVFLLHNAFGEVVIGFEIQIPKGEILQFDLHPVDAEPIGKRGVKLQGLLGYVHLSFRWLKFQGSHVVNPVRQTYEEYPDIGRHSQNHLTEILGLTFLLVSEGDLADLCQAVNEKRHFLSERLLDLFLRGQGVLHRIVEESCHERCRIELHVGQDTAHFHGVGEIGLTREADLTLMDGRRKNISLFDPLHFGRREIRLNFFEDIVDAEHGIYIPSLILDRTNASTASIGRSMTSFERRDMISTFPSASFLGPTVIRKGMPIRSASLNLTPALSSRSSRITSTPLSLSVS